MAQFDDTVKERIRFLTEIVKLLITMFAGTLGGSIALLTKENLRSREVVFSVFGAIFAAFFFIVAWHLGKRIRNYVYGN